MKTVCTLLIATLFTTLSFAQVETCDCKKDLDFLVKKMKKMPSYAHQINNKKENEFDAVYMELAEKMTSEISVEKCFKFLSRQMNLVKDYHASVVVNKEYFSKESMGDVQKVAEFKKTSFYKSLPRTEMDVGEIKNTLAEKPESAFEGIYYLKQGLVIGITELDEKNTYAGVVLESTIPTWEVGQIHFYATRNEDGKYDFYNYETITYRPRFVRNLTFENGRVWSYKKASNDNNEELYTGEEGNWIFKDLTKNVQYIRMSHFSGSTSNRKAQKVFLKELETKLTAKNLILDLKSNGGGSYEVSDPFLKLFKKKNIAIYVLTNAYTGSNGEQFTVKLKELKNTTHLGQATFGMVTYGSDKTSPTSPSKYFTFNTTDMDFHKGFFSYEGKGVVPEIKLDFDRDWIAQTLELIANNN